MLNRAVARVTLFDKSADYAAFEKVLRQAKEWWPVRLLAYCAMPNHGQLVLWRQADGGLSEFQRWPSVTHTQRWHAHRHTAGTGLLYQGRFESFPVEEDGHSLAVCRYVEGKPLRAGLVRRAEEWRWGSLWPRVQATERFLLDSGPVPLPEDWIADVNRPESELQDCGGRRSAGCRTAKKPGEQQRRSGLASDRPCLPAAGHANRLPNHPEKDSHLISA